MVVSQAEIGDAYSGGLGARLPVPRPPADDDTAERPVAGAAPAAVAVHDAADDATMTLTLDGLPEAVPAGGSLSRQIPESNGRRGEYADFGTGPFPGAGANGGSNTAGLGTPASAGNEGSSSPRPIGITPVNLTVPAADDGTANTNTNGAGACTAAATT